MVFGVAVLGYLTVRHYLHSKRGENHRDYSGRNHKLGASAETEDSYAATFSYMSVAIWGLVVAKAKAGVEAASKDNASSVGSLVKKAAVFTALIAAASLCQFLGSMNTQSATAPKIVENPSVMTASHKLQASVYDNHEASVSKQHPASYYDKTSSHYMGGAHNVLLNTKLSKDSKLSSEAMGGNHNVAMAVLAEQSNKFKKARYE